MKRLIGRHYNDSVVHKDVKFHPFNSVDKSSKLVVCVKVKAMRRRCNRGTMFHVFPKIEELL